MKTGTANLRLHGGSAPRWLFDRMVALSREIAGAVVAEHGAAEFLRRLSDPFWFQAFGCVLGFDWHSSGVTTTVCGALKLAVRGREHDLGLFIAGGKGKVSRQTPAEIAVYGDRFGVPADRLIYASRMSAKVDNSALQDGYQIYHHAFLFTAKGEWAVIQQGMNEATGWARRYHWLSSITSDFVCEPHSAICSDQTSLTLNMVAQESSGARQSSALLARDHPDELLAELDRLPRLDMPGRHWIQPGDVRSDYLHKILLKTYEQQPADFERLLSVPGVGPKTVRALALIAELVHGTPASVRDPARFSFAHGGKDGTPYPVDRSTYDRSIELLRSAVEQAKLGNADKLAALRRLERFGWIRLRLSSASFGRTPTSRTHRLTARA